MFLSTDYSLFFFFLPASFFQVTRDEELPTKYTLPATDKTDPNYAEDQSAFINETIKSNFQPFSLSSKDSNELTIELIQKKLKER